MTNFYEKTLLLKICFGLVWHNYDAVSVDRVLFYFLIKHRHEDDYKLHVTVQRWFYKNIWVLAYNEEHFWTGANIFSFMQKYLQMRYFDFYIGMKTITSCTLLCNVGFTKY